MPADHPANPKPLATTDEPERIEGPTPNGGAYALAYRQADGGIEIVEFDPDGEEIWRTYCEPPPK